MSFSSLQKDEMIEQTPHSACCRRAFLFGALAARASVGDGDIVMSVESYKNAEYIASLIVELYGKVANASASSRGGRRVNVRFESASLHKRLLGFCSFDSFFEKRCKSCESAFLRGIFFAAGRLTDPQSQYSLEFSTERSESLVEYFHEMGLSTKTREKSGQKIIYFKNSTDIEDFLATAAMNNAVFALMNTKIEHDLRNGVNRVVNCETNNIVRMENAAAKSVELISFLIENELLSLLPEELEMTAKLRYEHPDLSLASLAALHSPPISKPGLSHRLKKIEKLATEAINKKKTE